MKKYIEHLKTKPHHVRQRIALFTSLGITMVILVIWASSLNVGLSGASQANTSDSSDISPFGAMGAAASQGFESIKSIFTKSSSDTFAEQENSIVVSPADR
jgi:hypothetical protein